MSCVFLRKHDAKIIIFLLNCSSIPENLRFHSKRTIFPLKKHEKETSKSVDVRKMSVTSTSHLRAIYVTTPSHLRGYKLGLCSVYATPMLPPSFPLPSPLLRYTLDIPTIALCCRKEPKRSSKGPPKED